MLISQGISIECFGEKITFDKSELKNCKLSNYFDVIQIKF